VPDEPIVEAKMELLGSQGTNAFLHYQLPRAIIMLRQGFGRLIRTRQDRGMVAILDPRVMTKSYGWKFLGALPQCMRPRRFADLESFFQVHEHSVV